MQPRAFPPKIWTAVAERSGDTAFGRRPGVRKRRGASLPAAVQKLWWQRQPRWVHSYYYPAKFWRATQTFRRRPTAAVPSRSGSARSSACGLAKPVFSSHRLRVGRPLLRFGGGSAALRITGWGLAGRVEAQRMGGHREPPPLCPPQLCAWKTGPTSQASPPLSMILYYSAEKFCQDAQTFRRRRAPAAAAPPVRARVDLLKPSFHSHRLRAARPALRFGCGCAALCLSWSTMEFGSGYEIIHVHPRHPCLNPRHHAPR
jgi:hypothetical protein